VSALSRIGVFGLHGSQRDGRIRPVDFQSRSAHVSSIEDGATPPHVACYERGVRAKFNHAHDGCFRIQSFLAICSSLLVAALAGWAVLAITELVLLFGAMRVFARLMGPDLLPSFKVVLDMGALAICGWVAGRVGTPRVFSAAGLAAAGLAVYDFTPYLPLNVPWVLRLAKDALDDSRYLSSLSAAFIIHALMFGSLFAGAQLTRPRKRPIMLDIER